MKGFEHLIEFFREEGFRFEEHDTWISFKIEGNGFIAFKNDSPFLQIVMMINVEGRSRTELLETCNTLNQDKFITKFTVNEDSDSVWCSYEFEPTPTTKADDYMLAFRFIDKGTDEFIEKLNKK